MTFLNKLASRPKLVKFAALTTTSTLALAGLLAGAAQAQDQGNLETVVVSASRITANGFSAPTPVTAVSAADIQQNAQPNLFDTITELPALQGSVSTQSNAGNLSLGANGLDSLNLRGLGTQRTLTLIDGQRVVPAYITGINDISEFPQLLIQRVDVVTGGAGASWGSDAVGGVVNFITDKNFTGIKGNLQGGVSTYNDDDQGLAQVAVGTGFLGGKGHIEAAGEFYHSDGVPAPFIPGGALTNGRCCNYNTGTLSYTSTTTPAGVPEYTPIYYASSGNSLYGTITAGPLKGISFNPAGNPVQTQLGGNCVGTTCEGGDQSNIVGQTSIDNAITRSVFYTRASYNITPDLSVYATVNFGSVLTRETAPQGGKSGLIIQCGNAPGGANYYLPAAINADCVNNEVTNFTYSMSIGAAFPPTVMKTLRQQRRYVIGADGDFDMFGKNWTFEAHAEHGENDTSIHLTGIFLNPRFNAAIDAVAGPNGTVICRANAVTITAPGCVPFSIFGAAPVSPQAQNYVNAPVFGPWMSTAERQEAASVAVNGTPFADWAGDVAVAYGVEYREEAYAVTADPYAAGITPTTPNTPNYPFDPLLANSLGSNWYAANYHIGQGNYHVEEAFLETGIPLVDTPQWGKVNLDLAGRATEYSTTAGNVETWKVGTTWETPLDGIRLRALQSRDVRAPNLSELFAAPVTTNGGVTNRLLPVTSPSVNVQTTTTGNPNLKPETAQTTEVGVVWQPDYFPGFSASVDYYRVAIKKEIGVLSNQNIVDLCQIYGNTSYCGNFNLNGAVGTANPNYVNVVPFNLAQTVTDGFDIETSWQFDLQNWDIPGAFQARNLADHVSKYIVNTGVIGNPISEFAGEQISASPASSQFQAGVPLWKVFLIQSWTDDPYEFDLTERYFSPTVFNPYGVQCQAPSCPVPTVQNPTFATMNVPGYLFLDIGGHYNISAGLQAYFKVNNVSNSLPKPFAADNADPVGRLYHLGLRFNM